MNVSRSIVFVLAGGFGILALAFWISPAAAAEYFQVRAAGESGMTSLRADLGGLFAGLAVVCAAGAAGRLRSFLVAASVVLGAVAVGRVFGLAAGGASATQFGMLAAECGAVAALLLHARHLSASVNSARRMPARRWSLAIGVFAVVALVGLPPLTSPAVQLEIFETIASRVTARDLSYLLDEDALRVGVCGSSAPLPSATRAKPCVAVFAGGKFYIVDVGPESVENLLLWGIPLSKVGGVLLTHFHSDHIGDLGELNLQTWAAGRPASLAVYGGPGVQGVVDGFNTAFRLDQGYRTAHHTDRLMPAATWPMVPRQVDLPKGMTGAADRSALVLQDGALRITAIEVDHAPITPAYAYRFDYQGRSVVVSGDLKWSPSLAVAAKGADILVSEAVARPMLEALQHGAAAAGRDRQATILHDIQDYHLSPAEAGETANQAGVKLLVLYHLLPAPDTFLTRRLFGADLRGVRQGDWAIAEDGSLYTLPVGSDAVTIGRVK